MKNYVILLLFLTSCDNAPSSNAPSAKPCPSSPGGFTDCFSTSGIAPPREKSFHGGEEPERYGEGYRGQIAYVTGGAVGDFDEDGLPDLAWLSGTLTLYQNLGSFQFKRPTTWSFQEARWLDAVSAMAIGDLDRDGHLDLVLCRGDLDLQHARAGHPTETIEIWRGDGKGSFADASKTANLGELPAPDPEAVCAGLALADLDDDGYLDILPYYRSPWESKPHPVQMFLSQPDGTWRDRGAELLPNAKADYLWAVLWTDPDLWLLSAQRGASPSPWVWRRTSRVPLRFAPVTLAVGALRCPMGAAAANGWVFVTDNEDQHCFDVDMGDRARALGAALNPNRGSRALGFTPLWFDYDLGGTFGLFVTMSVDNTYNDPPHAVLLRGVGDRFEDASDLLHQTAPTREQGAALADFDRDGRMDILTVSDEGSPRLLRNEIPPRGHPLALRLHGTTSNREGIGARITVGEETIDVSASGATYGESERRPIFGVLGEEATVEILWPTGKKQVLEHVTSTEIEVEETP